MAASDKLRNLQGAASKERTQEELFAAFPQLLAVLEAAERQATLNDERRRGPMLRRELVPALAALDEALT